MRSTELLCNEAKICNIIRVINIQQEKQCISGVTQSGYAYAREMFCVYTDDGLFQKLYRYDETERILPDLLKSGYISFEYYYGAESVITPNGTKVLEGQKILRKELKNQLLYLSKDDFKGVCYSREELAWIKNKWCVVHGGIMHWKGENLPAFQYRDMDSNRLFKIDKCVGDKEMFKKDLSRYMSEFPLVQLIFSYYLSGPIRQILVHQSEGVGEYGLVACITGKSGSGKTTVTTTLQNILFGKGRMVSNNTTSKALYSIIKNSGICPVVRDDSSTDTQNGISHIKDKVMDIYNIASGKGRVTCNTEADMTLYAPFIESREENWGMADMVKTIRQVEGYKFRVLEIHCNKGDLTKDSQAARDFSALNGKYSGMSVLFLDYLVDKYSEQDIHKMYSEYVKEMDNLLTENELESRYANRTAVILTAARIAGEAFEISMDVEKIKMVMVDSIRAFERRLTATPDNWELKLLYNRFKAKNTEGLGINDGFIVDAVGNYNHKKHFVSFLQRKSGEFVIPAALMGIFISEVELMEPSFWGYDNNKLYTDVGEIKGEHWEAILQEWGDQGILIKNKKRATYTQTVKLNGIPTTCYHFNWMKIAQQFGDKSPLDMTRFAHDSEVEIINDF